MRKNIAAVITAFEAGKVLDMDSCRTDGKSIFSYATYIATRTYSDILLNLTKYSRTTSTQQAALLQRYPNAKRIGEGLPKGVDATELSR